MRLGSRGGVCDRSSLSGAAAPRPASREQRTRRGRVRLLVEERLLNRPRHARCFRCATDGVPLLFPVIAVPSSPCQTKGEEGTSMWGEEERWLERELVPDTDSI